MAEVWPLLKDLPVLPDPPVLDLVKNMQAILNYSSEGYILAGLDGKIRMINPSARRMLFSIALREAREGDNFYEFFRSDRLQAFLGFIEEVRYGSSVVYTKEVVLNDGLVIWIELFLTPVYERGEVTAACIRGRDVTSSKKESKLQQALMQERDEKKEELARAVIQAQEKQRADIGKELHDNINQMLASVRVLLQYALSNEHDRKKNMEKSLTILTECTEEIRSLSRRLVPPGLGDLGLESAIMELMHTLSLSGITVQVTGLSKIKEASLSADLKLSLFRIFQEQITNILKHAEATMVRLVVRISGRQVQMVLSDNGRGFDPKAARKGIGLNNIFNRASVYHVQVDLKSSPGRGTVFTTGFAIDNTTASI